MTHDHTPAERTDASATTVADANGEAATLAPEAPAKVLSPAAQRALAEAAARRAAIDSRTTDAPAELAGRGGLDPSRYGDWEIKGLAIDF